jgi:hypothetical protein
MRLQNKKKPVDLRLYTLGEILPALQERTGQVWTESMFLADSVRHQFVLNATAPVTSQALNREVQVWWDEECVYVPITHCYYQGEVLIGCIGPEEVDQLRLIGETKMTHAFYTEVDAAGETLQVGCEFVEPITVTRETLRIRHRTLESMVERWQSENAKQTKGRIAHSGDVKVNWNLIEPKRLQGYGKPLYELIRSAHAIGKARPTPHYVLETWRMKKPLELIEVMNDKFTYYDGEGNSKTADMSAIRKTISRMTTR